MVDEENSTGQQYGVRFTQNGRAGRQALAICVQVLSGLNCMFHSLSLIGNVLHNANNMQLQALQHGLQPVSAKVHR